MKQRISRWLDRILARSPLPAWFRYRHRHHLRVLAFHSVKDPHQFRCLMERLRRYYAPVGPEAVIAWSEGRRKLPPHAVLVTFDDGHVTVLEHGIPVLVSCKIPAVLFVVADLIGSERLPWWEEVEALAGAEGDRLVRRFKSLPDAERRAQLAELRHRGRSENVRGRQLTADELGSLGSSGVEIGNHTMTHPILPRCDDEVVEAEITEAHDCLTNILGQSPRMFAYPNGDFDPRAEKVLQRLKYRLGFLFDHRIARASLGRPLAVSRLRVDATTSLDRFELILSGLHSGLYHLRHRLGLP